MTARTTRFCSIALAAAFLVSAGCGGKKGTVEGVVTGPDGQPLPAGRIAFHGEKGSPVGGPIENGKFSVAGAPAGDNIKVTVETAYLDKNTKAIVDRIAQLTKLKQSEGDKFKLQAELDTREKELAAAEKEKTEKFRKIDDKYTKPDTTPLKTKVSGNTKADFKLE